MQVLNRAGERYWGHKSKIYDRSDRLTFPLHTNKSKILALARSTGDNPQGIALQANRFPIVQEGGIHLLVKLNRHFVPIQHWNIIPKQSSCCGTLARSKPVPRQNFFFRDQKRKAFIVRHFLDERPEHRDIVQISLADIEHSEPHCSRCTVTSRGFLNGGVPHSSPLLA